ncbi:hypothetical protein V2J09_008441 [Rumex salicifolius]
MPALKILFLSPPSPAFPAKNIACFAALQRIAVAPILPPFNLFKSVFQRTRLVYCNGDAQSSLGVDCFGAVFLLFREMGISEEDTQLVLEKNPDLKTSSFESIRGRIHSLQSLGINCFEVSSLIVKHPYVLTSGEVNSVISFIYNDLDNKIKPAQIARLLAQDDPEFSSSFKSKIGVLLKHGITKEQIPNILNQINLNKAILHKPVEEIDRMLTFLCHYGGIGVIVKRPTILNYDLDSQLAPRVGFLMNLSGDDVEATAVVIRRLPGVLLYSKEHMENQVEFMRSFAGLTYDEIFKIILTYPNLMSSSRERKLEPRIQFLKDCGFNSEEIYRLSIQSPLFLGLSFEANLAFKLALLVKIGYEYRTKDIAYAMGAVTRTSVENLQEVIGLYLSYGLSFEDIVDMSKKHPQILQYNPRSLERKMDYLIEVMGREISELLAFPAYLSYNLDKRIKPRYEMKRKIVGDEMSINKLLSVSVEKFSSMTERYELKSLKGKQSCKK